MDHSVNKIELDIQVDEPYSRVWCSGSRQFGGCPILSSQPVHSPTDPAQMCSSLPAHDAHKLRFGLLMRLLLQECFKRFQCTSSRQQPARQALRTSSWDCQFHGGRFGTFPSSRSCLLFRGFTDQPSPGKCSARLVAALTRQSLFTVSMQAVSGSQCLGSIALTRIR
jgi:hypothetical protein